MLDFPVPFFCKLRQALGGDPHNCVAETDGEVEGWSIHAGSLLQLSTRGRLLSVIPSQSVEWNGVPYAADHPVEFLGGEPRRGQLSRDVELDGFPLEAGSAVSLAWEKERLVVYSGTLSRDHWIEGHPCAEHTVFTRGPDQHLQSYFPSEPLDVGGLLLAPRCEVRLQDTERGQRLWSGTLARAAVIAGIPCAAGHPVFFDPEGELSQAVVGETFASAVGVPVRWALGTEVHRVQGKIIAGTLAERVVLGGVPCAPGPLTFRDDGETPLTFLLAEDHTVDGYPCRAGSRVSRGAEKHYELSGAYQSHGAAFGDGDVVKAIRRGGQLRPCVVLGSRRSIQGIELPARSEVVLMGTVIRSLILIPWEAIAVGGREVPAGSDVVLGLLGAVKAIIPKEPTGASYRESAR